MSIKTDALQQAAALNGTDTLLLANSAVGTAQLSLANLGKFLTGAETISSRTVEVEAAELPGYIASMPRLLAENLTVKIKAGTVPEKLFITHFYGPGSLTFKEKESGTVSFPISISIDYCRLPVYLEGLTIRNTSAAGDFVNITESNVRLKNCVFDRVSNTAQSCISLNSGANAYVRGCAFNNSGYGVAESGGGVAVLENCAGSGNVTGILIRCGIILLAGTTPELLGGSANARWGGGLIVKKDGTPL